MADDDRLILELTERALARRGHEVEVFSGGEEACEAAREGDYDLVLADLRMPGKTGLDVLRAAKARRPATPVFLTSGAWLLEERDEAERLGAAAILNKPVDAHYLYALIEKTLMSEKPEKKVDKPEKPVAETGPLAAPLVLVLEPDASMRKMLAYCLRRQGFRTTVCETPDEALEMAALEPPEAAIACGSEEDPKAILLVEGLRRDPACARTYVVFVYAEGALADAVHALDAGADVALEQPVEPDVLFAQVKAGLWRMKKVAPVAASASTGAGAAAGASIPGNGNGHRR